MDILFAALSLQDKNGGVEKKLNAQFRAFQRLGHRVGRVVWRGGSFWLEGMGEEKLLCRARNNPISLNLGFERAIRLAARRQGFALCYNRHIFCTPFHLKTLRQLKKQGIACVEELPTYPYDAEFASFRSPAYRIAAVVDRLFRRGYAGALDYFVTVSDDAEIFGVPAIGIENGVDVESIPFATHQYAEGRPIRLITISSMNPWHGYERLLQGLAVYRAGERGGPELTIDMVGDGPCRAEWETLSQSLGLGGSVRFHGQLLGKALDALLEQVDIGVGSLGMDKLGLPNSSTLKLREYMARGLPFVYANEERLLTEECDFCARLTSGDGPVEVEEIVRFYRSLQGKADVSMRLRSFAAEHYAWERWMGVVLARVG